MQQLEHKDAKAVAGLVVEEAVSNDGDKIGIVKALVSITGIKDHVGDIITPGAYARTLKTRKPKGVAHHSWDTPVSRTKDIEEYMPGDSRLPKNMSDGKSWPEGAGALYVETEFNLETQRGREAYSDIKFFGDDAEFSIGYKVPTGGSRKDAKTNTRHIDDLDLFEYSPVLFGAAPGTRQLAGVKSLFATDEEFLDAVNAVVSEEKGEKDEEETEEVAPDTEPDDGLLAESDKEAIANLVAEGGPDAPEDGEKSEETPEVTLADVVAELKDLKAAIAALAPVVAPVVIDEAIEAEEEKSDDESDIEHKVESSPLRKAMDELIYESTFDQALIDQIDEAVLGLEGSIKAADGNSIAQYATLALDGISKAKDSKPDEKTAEELNVLAKAIDEAVKAAAGVTTDAPVEEAAPAPQAKSISLSDWESLLKS